MRRLPTLETGRLILRPFLLGDAATVQRLAGDRAVADTTLSIPHPYADGMAEQWIAAHEGAWTRHEMATLAITEPEDGLVGAISLQRLHAQHFARNPASGRVLAKVGMQVEGTLRRHFYRWDRPEDVETWGLLRPDAPGSP